MPKFFFNGLLATVKRNGVSKKYAAHPATTIQWYGGGPEGSGFRMVRYEYMPKIVSIL